MLEVQRGTKRMVGKALSERTQDLKVEGSVKLICKCGKLVGHIYGIAFVSEDAFITVMCGGSMCHRENEFSEGG